MKKLMIQIAALAIGGMIAAPSFAGMEDAVYTLTCKGITTGATNSATYVLRGLIEKIHINNPATGTGTVTVSDSYGTIFAKTSGGTDAQYFPRAIGQTTAGATLTWLASGTNGSDGVGVTYTPTATEKIAVAGDVTVTCVQTESGGTSSENTNDYVVTIIYSK